MVRPTPPVRALFERVRRPLTMFAIGVGLAMPASAFMLREDGVRASGATADADNAELATLNASSVLDSKELAAATTTLHLSRAYNVPVGVAVQVHKAAQDAGITPRLAFGLVRTESEFRRTAVSPVGAVGLTQVMPGTARYMKPGTTRSDLFDPQTNLQLGFTYLKSLINRYGGNVRLALTAYNRGPGTVDKLVKRGRDPENGYATKVLADPAQVRLTPAQAHAAAQAAASTAVPAPKVVPAARKVANTRAVHRAAHGVRRAARYHHVSTHHVSTHHVSTHHISRQRQPARHRRHRR